MVGSGRRRKRTRHLHGRRSQERRACSRLFRSSGRGGRITLHTGDALEVLSEQKEQFDIIFNDVDKTDYPRVLRLVSPRLRKGGLFVADNVLWSGRVAEKNPREAHTKAILEFNRLLYASKDFYTTTLPTRAAWQLRECTIGLPIRRLDRCRWRWTGEGYGCRNKARQKLRGFSRT